jgi:hypothetical protein
MMASSDLPLLVQESGSGSFCEWRKLAGCKANC